MTEMAQIVARRRTDGDIGIFFQDIETYRIFETACGWRMVDLMGTPIVREYTAASPAAVGAHFFFAEVVESIEAAARAPMPTLPDPLDGVPLMMLAYLREVAPEIATTRVCDLPTPYRRLAKVVGAIPRMKPDDAREYAHLAIGDEADRFFEFHRDWSPDRFGADALR